MKYETFASRLGKGITKVRQEQNKTQAQIARDSGLSLKYVSMIETGTNPSIRTMLKMSDALEMDITAIMDQEGIGTLGRKKSAKAQGVQVDIPVEDRPEGRGDRPGAREAVPVLPGHGVRLGSQEGV
jgi:transcriptional regulator with XRE-family HTH domain